MRSSRPLLAVVLLATACGQATHTTPPASTRASGPRPEVALAGYASRTAHAGSARIALDMHMTSPGGSVTAHATGAVAFAPRAAEIAMTMTAPSGQSLEMREILRWPVVYMRSPAFARLTKGHKQWVKLNLAGVARSQGLSMDALAGSGSDDPAGMLTTLEGESDSVARVGTGTVRGVPTTRFHALIDLAKVARTAPPSARAAVRKAEQRLMAIVGVQQFPMDVWIDAHGLVRRVAYHMSLTIPGSGEQMTTSVRMDMYDFGTPVHVQAPPRSQTADLTALLAAQAPGATG